MQLDDFPKLLEQLEKEPGLFFQNTQKNINKAMLLYYLNSGYETCDQYKEYDANSHDKQLNKAKIMKDIQDQKLSNSELHNLIKDFFEKHSYINANLMSCGCCGLRLRERTDAPQILYKKLSLSNPMSTILKYNEDQLEQLKLEQDMLPVSIPADASFTPKQVHAWKIRSVYTSQKGLGTFHLHPELVDIDERNGMESTMVCPMCWDSIKKDEKPKLSIAIGIDFGYYERLGLEAPNLDEQMILA